MEIKSIRIDSITPYENNAKKHDQTQIMNVAESLKQYGFVQPIVVNNDGIIIIGHCRYYASQLLGLKEVPCVVADLSEEQERKLRLLDNKLNESEWDFEALKLELDNGISDLDFSEYDIDWGISEDDEEKHNKELEQEDILVALEIYDMAKQLNDINKLCNWIKDTYLSDIDI